MYMYVFSAFKVRISTRDSRAASKAQDMESPLMTPANESQQQGALEKALEEDWGSVERPTFGWWGITLIDFWP